MKNFVFVSDIDDNLATQELIAVILETINSRTSDLTLRGEPLHIYIDSVGGTIATALAIADMIHYSPVEISVTVTGHCDSSAILLFAAAHTSRRFVHYSSRFYFHQSASFDNPGPLTENLNHPISWAYRKFTHILKNWLQTRSHLRNPNTSLFTMKHKNKPIGVYKLLPYLATNDIDFQLIDWEFKDRLKEWLGLPDAEASDLCKLEGVISGHDMVRAGLARYTSNTSYLGFIRPEPTEDESDRDRPDHHDRDRRAGADADAAH